MIRLLIKETEATYGSIHVAGRELSAIERKKVPYYRRNVGVVFQDYKLLPNRNVHDNVAYALQVTGGTRREIREKVPDILRLTGLSTKLHSYPDQLSGGEQQRVSVARAFVNHPPLLLADEPTGNLDPETSIGIMQLLYRINRTGTTVVVATHDVDDGRPHAPARHPARAGPRRARREGRRLTRRWRRPASSPSGCAGRRRVRFGFFAREAIRALTRNAVPSFAAMATVLVTVLVLGVFIPVVQATTGAANDVRAKVIADVYLKPTRRTPTSRASATSSTTETPHVKRVVYISKEEAYGRRARSARSSTSCSAPTRCRRRFRVYPDNPDNIADVARRARAGGARRRAHGRSTRRSTRSATARTRRTRSSPPHAS